MISQNDFVMHIKSQLPRAAHRRLLPVFFVVQGLEQPLKYKTVLV